SLHALDLTSIHFGDLGLRSLMRSPHLSGLRRLDLTNNPFSPSAFKAIADRPWPALESLSLAETDLTPAGLRHLTGSPNCPALRSLNLCANSEFGDDGVRELAESPHLGALIDLNVGFCALTPEGVAALVKAPFAGRLRVLRLNGLAGGAAALR